MEKTGKLSPPTPGTIMGESDALPPAGREPERGAQAFHMRGTGIEAVLAMLTLQTRDVRVGSSDKCGPVCSAARAIGTAHGEMVWPPNCAITSWSSNYYVHLR